MRQIVLLCAFDYQIEVDSAGTQSRIWADREIALSRDRLHVMGFDRDRSSYVLFLVNALMFVELV